MIRDVLLTDAAEICRIYNYYILNTISTFELEPVAPELMKQRITNSSGRYPWLVWDNHGQVLGYACVSEWKSRQGYRYTVESSVYIDHAHLAKGLGYILYEELIRELTHTEFRTVIAGIALPNESSIRLHEKCGFRKTGQLERVGYKFGNYIDVGYWQLSLEPVNGDSQPK